MQDDEGDDFTPWTAEGAVRVRAAGEALAAAVISHAEAISRAMKPAHMPEVFAAGATLRAACVAYADAQFDHTGTSFPLGGLYELDDDEAEPGDEQPEAPTTGVSVLQRADYAIVDEPAVLVAGRAAYLRTWPDDDEQDAAVEVPDLGQALYQIGHAEGWDTLANIDGLLATGATVQIKRQDSLLGQRAEHWPEHPFHIEGEPLHEQRDTYY